MKALRGVVMFLLALTLSAPVLAADFEAGQDAYDRGDYATAVKEWRPLANQGDASAQTNLGYMYAEGQGVPQDYTEAVKWYRRAAQQGYAGGQNNLGRMYMYGQGVPQDYSKALNWYRNAAQQGYANSQTLLGEMYLYGKGVAQDYAEAAKWNRMAAEQGHVYAQYVLGEMYLYGKGVAQDYAEAAKWCRLSVEQGFPKARHCFHETLIQWMSGEDVHKTVIAQNEREARAHAHSNAEAFCANLNKAMWVVGEQSTGDGPWYLLSRCVGPGGKTGNTQTVVGVLEDQSQRPGNTFKDCPECPKMVVVPAGSFRMGDLDGGGDDDEKPAHPVTIPRSFAVSVYEVTLIEYEAFVRSTGHGGDPGCSWRGPFYWQMILEPVVCVSWYDAKAYVDWLSDRTGTSYRLLSESEWEYVARAGSQSQYSFGSMVGELCKSGNGAGGESGLDWRNKSCSDKHGELAPVGSYWANAFGLYDVHGNVWEWVEDCWNESYAAAPENGRAWLRGDCSRRVLRGGSLDNTPKGLRAANRNKYHPEMQGPNIGIRVARTL